MAVSKAGTSAAVQVFETEQAQNWHLSLLRPEPAVQAITLVHPRLRCQIGARVWDVGT